MGRLFFRKSAQSKEGEAATNQDTPPAEPRPIPEPKAFFLSRLFFEWLTPLLKTGYHRPLQPNDLYVLDDAQQAAILTKRFQDNWTQERQRPKPSLFRAFNRTLGRVYWPYIILRLVGDVITVLSPLFLNEVVDFAAESYAAEQNGEPLPDVGFGYAMVVGLFVMQMVGSMSIHWYFHKASRVGISVRTILTTSIYRKSLVLSSKARQVRFRQHEKLKR
jgi:ATP-binding cassette subfamily C (CFTR/MRP) protein 1